MKNTNTKRREHNSLKAYAAMGAAFLAVTPQEADAQVIYVDPPDITSEVIQAAGTGPAVSEVFIDLNGQNVVSSADPGADLLLYNYVFPDYVPASSWATARNFALGQNGAVVSNNITAGAINFYAAAKLNAGDNIAPGPGFSSYAGGGVLYNHRYRGSIGGTFRSTGNFKPANTSVTGYIGIQFTENGDKHYGWARVTSFVNGGPDFTATTARTVLHEYAYQALADTPIKAGQQTNNNIPTLSEWGLITLSLIVLSFGTVLIGRREEILAGQGTGDYKITSKFQRPPFFANYFKKALIGTAALAGIMAVFSQVVYGGITAVDFFGTMVAGPIFAYLMHLVTAYNDKFKEQRDAK